MSELEALVAEHGARLKNLEERWSSMMSKLDAISDKLSTVIAVHSASHTPENCPPMREVRREMAELKGYADELFNRMRTAEQELAVIKASRASGDKTINWWLELGRGVAVAVLVAIVFYFASHR